MIGLLMLAAVNHNPDTPIAMGPWPGIRAATEQARLRYD